MSLPAQVKQLTQEFHSNQRLRVGVWLIAGIIMFYTILALHDRQQGMAEEYQDLLDRATRYHNLTEQAEWPERAQSTKAILVNMQAKLLVIESRGLARANLQSWLDRQVKKNKIDGARIKVEPAAELPNTGGILRVSASVEGIYERNALAGLLLAVETGPPLMTIEQLDIKSIKRRHFNLVLKAYFQGTRP